MAHARRNRSTSNDPSSRCIFLRLMLDRLQAVSSRNMYSLHGFEALIGPVRLQVCHVLIVVSYCRPGSPQNQVPSAISRMSWLAGYVGPSRLGSVTQCV